jgi:hypothetical protein
VRGGLIAWDRWQSFGSWSKRGAKRGRTISVVADCNVRKTIAN